MGNTDVNGAVTRDFGVGDPAGNVTNTLDLAAEIDLGTLDGWGHLASFVASGMGLTYNAGGPTVDIAHGRAFLYDESAPNIAVSPVSVSGISLGSSTTNYLYVAVKDSSGDGTFDQIFYHQDTDESAPSQPSLKIGEIDTSNDTVTETNREPLQPPVTASGGTFEARDDGSVVVSSADTLDATAGIEITSGGSGTADIQLGGGVLEGGVSGNFLGRSAEGGVRRGATAMPEMRRGAAYAVVDDVLYTFGGSTRPDFAENQTDDVRAYDPTTDTWSTKAAMPTARNFAGAFVTNSKVYVCGGSDGSTQLSTVEEYDPANDSWTSKTSLSTAVEGPYAADGTSGSDGGYIIGGFDGSNDLATVQIYDAANDSWSTGTDRPTVESFGHFKAPRDSGIVYTWDLGGGLEAYDVSADSWSTSETDLSISPGSVMVAVPTGGGDVYLTVPNHPPHLYDISADSYTRAPARPATTHTAEIDGTWEYEMGGLAGGRVVICGGQNFSDINNIIADTNVYVP